VSSAEALLLVQHVSRRFDGGIAALQDVSLDIARGKITAFIGASGSGKTTLLRLIAGLDTPTAGDIMLSGRPRIGYVFQQPALLPWANVTDNIALPAKLTSDIVDVHALLEQVGLSDKGSAYPHQLSGGQQMRVSIARALARHPDLLLLDEPFAALDEITRQRLCDLVLELAAARQLTVLFVTHNISEAVYVADTVVLMAAGKIADKIDITAPSSRSTNFRSTQAYAQHCSHLSQRLAEVMG
jgi:NitT/TauT family transport system ATP-binding protein